MRRTVWIVLLGLLLSACGVYEVRTASVNRIEVLPNLTVRVVAHGTLGDGCTCVGDVLQRREAQTFFVTVREVYNRPLGTSCTLAVSNFRQEVLLETQDLEPGPYEVNVNGTVESFTSP